MGLVSFVGKFCSSRRISSPCSPSIGGGRTSSARSPSNETGERTVLKSPITGCSAEAVSCRCTACGSSERLAGVVHRRVRHVEPLEPLAPFGARALRERCAEQLDQRLLVIDPCLARREARVVEQVGLLDRLRQALPELLGRRHVQRDPLAVAAFEHVRLRDARPAVRAHHLVGLEEVRERVEVEVRHRLEHRHLDRAADARAAALDKRAEHAVGGVEAGQRIGDRRPDDARVLGVDEQLQEAARSLRDGVVRGPRRRRAGRAEAADRGSRRGVGLSARRRTAPTPSFSATPGRKFWM